MNPRRGHESTEHLQAKVAVSHLFDDAWSVFFEQRNADILVLHHCTRFVAAIEVEGSWSARLDGNANQFSAPFEFTVSDRYGNAKSESLFRTPIGTESDGNANFFA